MNRPVSVTILSGVLALCGFVLFLKGGNALSDGFAIFPIWEAFLGLLMIFTSGGLMRNKMFGLYLATAILVLQFLTDTFKAIYWTINGYPEYFEILPFDQYYLLYAVWVAALLFFLKLLYTEKSFKFFRAEKKNKLKEFLKGASLGVVCFCLIWAAS